MCATAHGRSQVDAGSSRVILVKQTGNLTPGSAHEVTVTGMLRGMSFDPRHRVQDVGGRIQGLPVETRYELAAGERPGEPLAAVALGVLAGLLFVACCLVKFQRDAIFQGGGSFAAPLGGTPLHPVLVRTTGRFSFDTKTARRFADIPAILTLENGRPVLQSKIDTSRRFMGISGGQQVGIWSIPVTPGSLAQGRFGFAYFGFARRYAFRFYYVDARDGKLRRAMVASDEPRDLVMAAAIMAGAMSASYATTV